MTGRKLPVLIVTRLDDVTADVVIEHLNRRRVPVIRLDPGDFPETVAFSARMDDAGLSGSLRTASRGAVLDRVRSVYWRRPRPYTASAGLEGQARTWCVGQARYGLGGVLASLPGAHYVNHPWRNRDAEYKPAQLATAARCGLAIPPSLVTNEPSEARRFAREYGRVIYKPLRHTDVTGPDHRPLTVWVEDVQPDELHSGVAHTAHLFQQRITSVADLRLTVVGEQTFTVRIDGAPGKDWRRHYDDLTYTLIDTPPDLAKGVRDYLNAFGLVFGAFDFGLDADNRPWMYECNPNGQWAFCGETITDQIATALADRLQHAGEAP
ncbi:ATP-grasp ribosomal peptide maturase [Streptomyces sp. NPDC026294]|uniref:ATP-grasp ribosomal peptide maturase n=1 Tax=Streptomyces sp. NPDC026294 TaxID=3155362 RepID=UPI0033F04883